VLIRHCVEESNVNENMIVIDPRQIRHVVVMARRIKSLSGLIDPTSHLNLDFPDHKVTTCIIAEKFQIGAAVKLADRGLVFAAIDRSAFNHYGPIDYTKRLSDMIEAVNKVRQSKIAKEKEEGGEGARKIK
jgi:hypothetical protein